MTSGGEGKGGEGRGGVCFLFISNVFVVYDTIKIVLLKTRVELSGGGM